MKDVTVLDHTWTAVAQHLGPEWHWTRRREPDREPLSHGGWLKGPAMLGLFVRDNEPRWTIGESMNMRVPETGEGIETDDLYRSHEERPRRSITVARGRPADSIAREIRRRLLPGLHETALRLAARIRQASELFTHRQAAVEAFRRLCPNLVARHREKRDEPLLSLRPLSLDVRIHDAQRVSIVSWSELSLDAALELVQMALAQPEPSQDREEP